MRQNMDGARKAAHVVLSSLVVADDLAAYTQTATLDSANIDADPDSAELVVAEAESGNPEAIESVRGVISRRLIDGEALPEPLLAYTLRMLLGDGPKSDRRRSHKNYMRDQIIIVAVRAVVPYGFSLTRNRAMTAGPSACSVVADVLAELGFHMTEANVETIVRNYHAR